ncbi:MAG: hypothetical protein ACXWP5_00390, partial [Bdellovibrionota bacterium]
MNSLATIFRLSTLAISGLILPSCWPVGGVSFIIDCAPQAVSTPHQISVSPTGALFSVGAATLRNYHTRWITRMSVDQGEHWSTVDDFSFSGLGSQANAIAFGPNGEAYVIGTASDSSQEHWIVRKSPLGGQNWSTVDDLPLPDSNIWTVSLIAGSDGGIYAIGNWNNWHGGATHWLARKSDPKTGLWATVDDFQPSGPSYPVPRTAVRDSNGNIYVAGILNGPSVVQGIVRKSADQGATWATINIPVSSIDGTDGGTFYMDSDSAGNLYLVTASSQKITSGYNYTWNFDWVVQTSPDGALTWNLSDDVFQSGASYQGTATLTGFGQGIPGHFFLIGSGSY